MSNQIELQFLGTGTILPSPRRSCSATLLTTSKERILIDAGAGTLLRLREQHIHPLELTYIFFTHYHPDHVADLIPILFCLRNCTWEENEGHRLRVWGPRGLLNHLRGLEQAYGRWVQNSGEEVKFYELKRRLLDFPGFRLIWGKVIHKSESVGYRFEVAGRVICFSGDSGYCQELIRLCHQADLAVLECSHPDEHAVEGHLSPSLAGKIAESAGVKKLILNHFYPDAESSNLVEVASKFYSGPIVLAEDGLKISLPVAETV